MSAAEIQAISEAATFIASVGFSTFISGAGFGKMKTDLQYIKRDLETIKSMFTLTIKLPDNTKDGK